MLDKENYIIERLGEINSLVNANYQLHVRLVKRFTYAKRAAGIGLILAGIGLIQANKRIDELEKEIKELKAEKEI